MTWPSRQDLGRPSPPSTLPVQSQRNSTLASWMRRASILGRRGSLCRCSEIGHVLNQHCNIHVLITVVELLWFMECILIICDDYWTVCSFWTFLCRASTANIWRHNRSLHPKFLRIPSVFDSFDQLELVTGVLKLIISVWGVCEIIL